jgi:hypothetical protein
VSPSRACWTIGHLAFVEKARLPVVAEVERDVLPAPSFDDFLQERVEQSVEFLEEVVPIDPDIGIVGFGVQPSDEICSIMGLR